MRQERKDIISIIVPVYNEEESLIPFLDRLNSILLPYREFQFEYVFVNDGSTDNTYTHLLSLLDTYPYLRIINFSRNFGKEQAIMAGIQNCTHSQAVIISDVDMQDPPEVIEDFIKRWKEGYKNVYGIRNNRDTDSFFKRFTASLFYKLFNKLSLIRIPNHAGDFRLLDQSVVKVLAHVHNKNLFMKGLYSWAGFSSIGISYSREKRTIGKSKFPFLKLLRLSFDGIFNFTTLPLKLASIIGFFVSTLSFIFAAILIFKKIFFGNPVPGYTSIIVSVCFFFGVQFILIGILGEYISRIYDEVKNEPPFIIESILESKHDEESH